MSQASNKVKWCLNKAKKELEETALHRGLIEQEKDFKSASLHIAKAKHNLNAALFFQKNDYSDWSASAFFYCIYHCFLAILHKFGFESRNQECTIAVIEMLKEQGKIDIDEKFISTLKQQNSTNLIEMPCISRTQEIEISLCIDWWSKWNLLCSRTTTLVEF